MTSFWFALGGFLLGAGLSALFFIFERQKHIASNAVEVDRCRQFKEKAELLEQENKELACDIQKLREDAVMLDVQKKSFELRIEQIEKDRAKHEEVLISKFENLSNQIFDQKSDSFKKQSQETISNLLNPLKEKLVEFEKKVEDSFGEQSKEQYSLKEEIKNIIESNEKITLQAQSLANALKGDSKVQGDWGEVILEKILEDSGLRKNIDYIVQGGGLNLRDIDDRLQKPDVIVKLPENKHVIIDSKVSLTHYERFFSETDNDKNSVHLKQFLASVKKHIGDLEKRRYQDIEKLGTPDFVLMFIPIEAAYILAVQEDPQLQNYAWNKKVVLVCPTTLFATLRTIASVWRLELQNKNALEIARQGGQLYDKIAGFVGDMQVIGKKIDDASSAYIKAINKLSDGRGNILSKTEKLKELGAKTSKSLPQELLDRKSLAKDSESDFTEDKKDQAA